MVIDSSALMAILMNEPEREDFLGRIAAEPVRFFCTATYMECSMLMFSRKGGAGVNAFDALVKRLDIELIATDADQAISARQAFIRFGKGIHPAKLNMGDCFSYALAKQSGERLLFKGNDFGQTDISVV
jgi:ribonuclease VapC